MRQDRSHQPLSAFACLAVSLSVSLSLSLSVFVSVVSLGIEGQKHNRH